MACIITFGQVNSLTGRWPARNSWNGPPCTARAMARCAARLTLTGNGAAASFWKSTYRGAAQIRARYPDCVSIFLRASSLAAYEQRLRKRGTEQEEAIRRRVAAAERELQSAGEYDYEVINDDLDRAVADLSAIVRQQFPKG